MSMKSFLPFGILIVVLLLASCNDRPREVEWMEGTTDQMLATIAKQLRGFDATMVETGYRYSELYWAGRDENWQYAMHQVEEMRDAIEKGLERRPARAASAVTFLTLELPAMEEAIKSENPEIFWNRFNALTSNCNTCHGSEGVGYMKVQPPQYRQSIIVKD